MSTLLNPKQSKDAGEAIERIKNALSTDDALSAGVVRELQKVGKENECADVYRVVIEVSAIIPK